MGDTILLIDDEEILVSYDEIDAETQDDELEALVSGLTEREWAVVLYCCSHTVEETALHFSITEARVRQILCKTIRRTYVRSRRLKDFSG